MTCYPAKGVYIHFFFGVILRSVDAVGHVNFACSVVGQSCFGEQSTQDQVDHKYGVVTCKRLRAVREQNTYRLNGDLRAIASNTCYMPPRGQDTCGRSGGM